MIYLLSPVRLLHLYYLVFWLVGNFFRKGQLSLRVSDQQFSHPEVINIQAFSTQVM